MSLLVTSCTMGQQPDRLLNKGPDYLRTRTNRGMFTQHRKSAVELLAASKSQFYSGNGKDSVCLDKQQDLAFSPGQSQRFSEQNTWKEPPRSKSEYDLSHIERVQVEEESDENNNDTSDDSSLEKTNVLEGTKRLSLHDNLPRTRTLSCLSAPHLSDEADGDHHDNPCHVSTKALVTGSPIDDNEPSAHTPKLTILRNSTPAKVSSDSVTPSSPGKIHEGAPIIEDSCLSCPAVLSNKPTPLPRKLKQKPVPPPRNPLLKLKPHPLGGNPVTPDGGSHDTNVYGKATPVLTFKPPLTPHSAPSLHTSKLKTSESSSLNEKQAPRKKKSLVQSLTQHFTALSALPVSRTCDKPISPVDVDVNTSPEVRSVDCRKSSFSDPKPQTANADTYVATPIFIGKPITSPTSIVARPVFVTDQGTNTTPTVYKPHIVPCSVDLTGQPLIVKTRKRCPDVPTSNKYSKRERKSSSLENSSSTPLSCPQTDSKIDSVEKSVSSSASKSEMSIESVGQAVCESETNANPTVPTDMEDMQEDECAAREVTRANSSLSGKMEPQESSSQSPSHYYSSVPRSHSDISCRLEGQHSRDSSIVSSHSRLSRASAGADLENFFNQMGLEKGVLEPISRLKDLQACELFDSVSSLDSQDAASICSTYSRSEHEWSESQSVERLQHPTSVVERNARIIKWLCNVRKAKTAMVKSDKAAAGKA